ncbi:DNA repair protein RadC [Parasphingopyxis sp. CP4]|uniref:JAB domain-containing protein n=1 Tax=Parasphingopyxis sp. CP4 TaxID=2724527 RepID=UPI0015A0B5EC|nr:DNA repair protein RadC [Parasphingopyxis sp. CP4]QLC20862.1 DNA repair protein RadC [Parasphingopyxis sp. CP4]
MVLSDSALAPHRNDKLPSRDPRPEPQATLSGLLEFISPASADHLAEKLLDEFGSLPGIIGAEQFRLEAIDDVPDAALRLLTLVGDAFRQSLSSQISNRPILSSSVDLMDYLRATIGYWRTECFRVLFLDTQNHLIRDEILQLGSVSKVVVDPRRILAQALRLDATALILVHNHPSGICQPSAADIAVTECLAESAALFDIAIHDHLIVAADGCASLKSLGIL